MDRNTVIGLTLIFLLLVVWQQVTAPSPEELEAQQRMQDSIALAARQADSLELARMQSVGGEDNTTTALPDSIVQEQLNSSYGPFSAAAQGTEETIEIANDVFTVAVSNKGGRVQSVNLKDYLKSGQDEEGKDVRSPLYLLEDEKNKFEYILPVPGVPSGTVKTSDLYFTIAEKTDKSVTLRAAAGEGRYFEQKYSITDGSYKVDYSIRLVGLQQMLSGTANEFQLNWVNYLDKLERNVSYERNYSTVYYRPLDDDMTYCSCTSSDEESTLDYTDPGDKKVKWVSNSNQFFNSTLLAKESFAGARMETVMLEEEDPDLKKLVSNLQIPLQHEANEQFDMTFYIGPNSFDRLQAMGEGVEYVIPYGSSIFGTVNRWIIRPLFNFLSGFLSSKGLVILLLTFIVKLILYPLTYRMLYSQSKMGALKPRLEGLKEKFKDDPQQQQREQMKIYSEFGVSPLGGCMPMVLQMPIWIALYRFFPAAIEFRQSSFLWATDLSSYDVFFRLPLEIPFFGAHLSLFTLLWAITTLIYTYYNTRHMDMSANPAMKYMQYLMPVFFLGFFNSFASGLTCYLFFSNLFNITQTVVTKNYIIDQDKIQNELEEYRKKPKKKGGFQQRLEAALKEQQKIQAQKDQGKKKKK